MDAKTNYCMNCAPKQVKSHANGSYSIKAFVKEILGARSNVGQNLDPGQFLLFRNPDESIKKTKKITFKGGQYKNT